MSRVPASVLAGDARDPARRDPPMGPDEAAAAAVLHALAFAGPDAIRPWTAADFAGFCDSPGAFRILAPEKGRLDALMLGRVIGPEAELVTLATRPLSRRRGFARALLARFALRAAALGAETAFLEVAEPNEGARALYAAAGWAEVGFRRNCYRLSGGGRANAVVMSCDLGAVPAENAGDRQTDWV